MSPSGNSAAYIAIIIVLEDSWSCIKPKFSHLNNKAPAVGILLIATSVVMVPSNSRGYKRTPIMSAMQNKESKTIKKIIAWAKHYN